MKIVIATPLYPPELGGPATYSFALNVGLPAKDIEPILLHFGAVRHLPKGIRHLVFFWKAFQAARAADLLLALDPVSVGLPARLAALLARKPFVVKIVGDYAWEQGRQRHGIWMPLDEFVRAKQIPLLTYPFRFIQTHVAKSAKAVIVPSKYLKGIVTLWGVPEERIHVIYNAVPHTEPAELPEAVSSISGPVILTVGRLVPWKGIHGIISSLVDVRKEVPNSTLVIVGEGPEQDALSTYANRRLPEGAVVFTGKLPPAETLSVIRRADLFVLNSTYEGLSHVLIEAMSLARPIIATKAGGNAELIEDKKTGLLISVGDTASLGDAITYILENADAARMLGEGAKERSADFSGERMLSDTAEFLRSLV